MNTMNEFSYYQGDFGPQPVLVLDDELARVTDEFLQRHGHDSLGDVDTPSFMRRYHAEAVREPEPAPIFTTVPELTLDLLRVLFREEEEDFTFQAG